VCARTTLTKKTLREVAGELEAEFSEEDALTFRPRFNAAPSETLWILRHGADCRVVAPAVWGYRAKERTSKERKVDARCMRAYVFLGDYACTIKPQ
jgi:putative SOS response-associated peptidase YedK